MKLISQQQRVFIKSYQDLFVEYIKDIVDMNQAQIALNQTINQTIIETFNHTLNETINDTIAETINGTVGNAFADFFGSIFGGQSYSLQDTGFSEFKVILITTSIIVTILILVQRQITLPHNQKLTNPRRYQANFKGKELKQQNQGFSNQLLLCKKYEKGLHNELLVSKYIFYVPTYTFCKLKSVQDIDINKLTGKINCVIIIYIKVNDLPDFIIKRLRKDVQIQINRGEIKKLKEEDIRKQKIEEKNGQKNQEHHIKQKSKQDKNEQKGKDNKKQQKSIKYIQYVIRMNLDTDIHVNPFMTPFDLTDMVFSITFNTLKGKKMQIKPKDGQPRNIQYQVSFNNMRNSQAVPIPCSRKISRGVFDLAEKKLQSYHTNEDSYLMLISEKSKFEQKDKKNFSYFQYVYFFLPFYKYPGNFLVTFCLPLLFLAIISQAILNHKNEIDSIGDMISAVATLVLGYIQLLPFLKEQIPPSSSPTLIEIFLYIETLCSLLCLLDFVGFFQNEGLLSQGSELIGAFCFIVHSFIFISIIIYFIYHKFVLQRSYNSDQTLGDIKPFQDPKSWNNHICDLEIQKYNQTRKEARDKVKTYEKTQDQELLQIRYELPAEPKKQEQAKFVMVGPLKEQLYSQIYSLASSRVLGSSRKIPDSDKKTQEKSSQQVGSPFIALRNVQSTKN